MGYTDQYKKVSIGQIPNVPGKYILSYPDKSFKVKVIEDDVKIDNDFIFVNKQDTNYGQRRLFICPYCGESREHLYFINGNWKCRECGNLKYRSTVTYRDGMDYCDLKIRKICSRLRVYPISEYYTGDEIPDKPKGMRWSTYSELIRHLRYWQCERYNRWLRLVREYLKM